MLVERFFSLYAAKLKNGSLSFIGIVFMPLYKGFVFMLFSMPKKGVVAQFLEERNSSKNKSILSVEKRVESTQS